MNSISEHQSYLFPILAILLLGLSCISCENHRLKRQLEVFHGTPITISDNLRVITNGKKDSLHFDISDKFARFIVYVDSLECSSCRAGRMYEYNGVIDFRDSVGMQFMPIFIFSPPERVVEELLYQVRVSYFDYPILLDDSGLFPIINPHIPTDPRFHTFLLDKNGKVVLVGDPVHNPGLWELYKKTITELIENGGTLAQCC